MIKKQKFVDAFVVLGNLDLSENIITDIEEFTAICMVTQTINTSVMC